VPEELTNMVENLMKNQFQFDDQTRKNLLLTENSNENSLKFIFNIWDFTGYTLYFLLHQVFYNLFLSIFNQFQKNNLLE
jgi:hypothetical protein